MTKRSRFTVGLALAAALGAAACAEPTVSETGEPVVAFTNVTVIPMDREHAIPDQTVIIRGEHIAEIGPAGSVSVPAGATEIDGTGKFLMPGVAELHAHIPGGNASDEYIERVLKLFVANGVTVIRGMLGDPRHLPLRDRTRTGDLIGPEIYTAGPSFNANSATSPEVAVQMVRDQHEAGYDLLKIHPGVPRDAFDAMAEEADRLGIRFAGHVPADVGLMRALEARYHSIDHIDGYFEYAVRDDAPVDRKTPGFFGVNFAAYLDEAKLQEAAAKTREAGVWIVPTHGLLEIFYRPETPQEMRAIMPGVEYMPPEVVEGWMKSRQNFQAQAPPRETIDRFLEERRRLLKLLHDEGVGIAMGSDAVQVFSVPGFSIVNEMEAMADSGLTPYEIYVTGTRNVARFFGREHELGTVEVSKIANLVLVEADPLASVSNFANQTGTMVRGRWHARADLLSGLRPPTTD